MFTVCRHILLFKMTSLNSVLFWCQGFKLKKIAVYWFGIKRFAYGRSTVYASHLAQQ